MKKILFISAFAGLFSGTHAQRSVDYTVGDLKFTDVLYADYGGYYHGPAPDYFGASALHLAGIVSTGQSGAYEEAFEIAVNDTGFVNASAGSDTNHLTHTLTTAVQMMEGLKVSKEFYFPGTLPIVRLKIKLENPGSVSKSVKVDIASTLGSGGYTQVDSNSTGTPSLSNAARWLIISDGISTNTPAGFVVNTWVRFGPGTIQSSPSFKYKPVVNSDSLVDTLRVNVPANSYVYVVIFNRLDSTVLAAKNNVALFNNVPAMIADSLFRGISDYSKIVNWHLAPPYASFNTSANAICKNATINFTNTSSLSDTYLWDFGDGSTSSAVNTVHQYTTAGTFTASLTATNTVTTASNKATALITVHSFPAVAITGSNSICIGKSTLLTASGASTYLWASGATTTAISVSPTSIASYSVTGTDANTCSNTATVTVTVNSLPTVSITGSTTICSGSAVTLTAGGANTYLWASGSSTTAIAVSPSSTTNYTVTGTDANMCSNSATADVTVKPVPNLTTSLNGFVISATQNGATYQWINCNNNSIISGATSQNYTVTSNGSYAAVITVSSCSYTTTCVNITTVGVKENSQNNLLTVYPNPSQGTFTIQSANEGVYSILNELGAQVELFKLNASNKYAANIENLSNGIYYIVGFNGDEITRQKIVVTR